MRHAPGIVIALVTVTVCTIANAAEPSFVFEDGLLTITTDRWEVQWRDGAMVGLRTMLPRPMSLMLRDGPMAADSLPAGVCSLHEHDDEARAQHHPWNVRDISDDIAFPAQHAPGGDVTMAEVPGGVELAYRGLAGEPDAVLVQRLTVDAATGDLVVEQSARSPNPGLIGISLPLRNLRGDIELAMPYFGGQRFGKRFCEGRFVGLAFPPFWNASLLIGELPAPAPAAGEAAGGTFMIWAQDEHFRPKHVYIRHEGAAQGLAFESMAEAPYEDRTAMDAVAWRFNTWAGGWMEPAARFKQWYFDAHDVVPRAQRSPAWMDEIALVWPSHISAERMEQMAEVFPTDRILMMQWGWLDGFNRRVPEYIAKAEDFAETCALAHSYGAKVGVYTSCGLIDVEAFPEMAEETGIDYKDDAPWRPRETPGTQPDRWLWYIHPGSAAWRDFYAGRMRAIVDRYGIDYLYQDVSGGGVGSSGLVEGLGYHEAMVACETAIRERVPEAALGGEFWTEVNACREDFGIAGYLAWDCGAVWEGDLRHRDMISQPHQQHPFMGYIFSDSCLRWPHNVPIRDTRKFHQIENINEVTGAIPVWTTDPDDLTGEARVMLEKARLWAAGFRPWFPERWAPDAVGYLRTPGGRVIRYDRPAASSFCVEEAVDDEVLVYARVTGVSEVALGRPARIDGWAAYDEAGPIGLDPARYYCAFPGEPADVPVIVTALPEGARIVDTRACADYLLAAIDGEGPGEVRWRAGEGVTGITTGAGAQPAGAAWATETLPTHLLVGFAPAVTPALGEVLPLDTWAHRIMAGGLVVKPGTPIGFGRREVEGEAHEAPFVQPPPGGPGSEYLIDGYLALPDAPDLALHFWGGQTGAIGDGVHFVVRVNGREVWRHFRETGPGWEELRVPLSAFAGQTVLLSLAIDAGVAGHNTSCDASLWGDATLVSEE